MKKFHLRQLYSLLLVITVLILQGCSDDDNPIFKKPLHKPIVNITSPESFSVYNYDDNITFSVTATDEEDGVLSGESLVWISDVDGEIGTGETFTTDSLSNNIHLISLIATDSDSNVVSKDITLSVVITFEKTFGGTGIDKGNSIIATSDGNYVIVGSTESSGSGDFDVYLLKTDKFGNLIWERTFGGASDDVGVSVIESSNGGFLLIGTTESSGSGLADVYLVRTDDSGILVWDKIIGGTERDRGLSVVESSDGRFVITGSTESYGAGRTDMYLVKIDFDGTVIWEKTFGGTDFDLGRSVIETSGGGFLITGITKSGSSFPGDVYLIKTDSVGELIWETTAGIGENNSGTSVIETSDGNYLVAGLAFIVSDIRYDAYLLKFDTNGNLLWERSFGGSGSERVLSVIETINGNFVMVGSYAPPGSLEMDAYIIKTDINGIVLWSKIYGGPGSQRANSIIETPEQGYIITGESDSSGTGATDLYILRTDSEGNVY